MTCNRPEMLLGLLKQINEQFNCDYVVRIYNDASDSDYSAVEEYIKDKDNYIYQISNIRHGRFLFWKLHRKMYADLKGTEFDYYIQLADDLRLNNQFSHNVIDQFNKCGADLLYIMCNPGAVKLWKKTKVKIFTVEGISYYDKHWTDCTFITTKKFFNGINYTVPKVSIERWMKKPGATSNMGTVLTNISSIAGLKVVGVVKNLVEHMGHKSVLNFKGKKNQKAEIPEGEILWSQL